MASFEYLADGHHVDDAGNLIACTCVDFRDPAERFPITVLRRASSKQHAIPGCETIRISKPSCFLQQGEGLAGGGEAHYSTNGWVYCASIEPATAEEQAAWYEAMPAGCDAVSPIRRPRAFARALGAMVAEQAGPRGRMMLLRSTVEGESSSTAHRSQTVYHGPVVYSEDLRGRLARASSDLELLLLLVFLKEAAMRAQREYRFAVWMEQEPEEDTVDLQVSPALVDAMWKPRPEPEGSGFVPAGAAESSTVEEVDGGGFPGARKRVDVLPAFAAMSNPAVAPRRYDAEGLPSDLREAVTAHASVEALREAVERTDAGSVAAAAAAWHAEPVVRFLCSTFGDRVAGVRVNEEGLVVLTAALSGDEQVEASIAVGPDGACAYRISAGETHLASTAPDAQSFERMLRSRLAEVGVRGQGDAAPG